ncbi:hypothetical protein [Paraburkholderia graminis]|uniref:hypothetical protein n=1 Tax=Paraburkholderia graminis TaxID=60548 RepID=UPI0038BA8FD2
MSTKEILESRINCMLSEMDNWPELGESLARDQKAMQESVRGTGGTNSSGSLVEKFAADPYSLSRFR